MGKKKVIYKLAGHTPYLLLSHEIQLYFCKRAYRTDTKKNLFCQPQVSFQGAPTIFRKGDFPETNLLYQELMCFEGIVIFHTLLFVA